MITKDDIWLMEEALLEATKAYKEGEVPVGAVIVGKNRKVLARAKNQKEKNFNPCGHAEILAIQEAAKELSNWRLNDCTLYVTLEPCPMCLGAISQSRVKRVVFGSYDSKGGALSLGYNLNNDSRLNHRFEIVGGLKHFECSKILSDFFKERRGIYKK